MGSWEAPSYPRFDEKVERFEQFQRAMMGASVRRLAEIAAEAYQAPRTHTRTMSGVVFSPGLAPRSPRQSRTCACGNARA
jgi:hypothetical protein